MAISSMARDRRANPGRYRERLAKLALRNLTTGELAWIRRIGDCRHPNGQASTDNVGVLLALERLHARGMIRWWMTSDVIPSVRIALTDSGQEQYEILKTQAMLVRYTAVLIDF